jgi:hypothetical protein
MWKKYLFLMVSAVGAIGSYNVYKQRLPRSGYIVGSPLDYCCGDIVKGSPYTTRNIFRYIDYSYLTPALIKVYGIGTITCIGDRYLSERMEIESFHILSYGSILELVKEGADLNIDLEPMIKWAASEGKLDILKYLDKKQNISQWSHVIKNNGTSDVVVWYNSKV